MNQKQVWLVTGAGRGLGLDVAKAALAAGHAVVAMGRDPAKVENEIIVLGNQAALYARADSYFENRTFRDPKFWSALSPEDRRTF